ncbi:MAG: heme ABC transporter permease [Gammaproteobacteria bacterium]|nr:heme ABC transporter permease [Gammaproteobacteria bacterium]
MLTWLHKLGSPPLLYRVAGRATPWLIGLTLVLMAAGLVGGLWLAPPDYQMGDGFRIIYIHVPSALLSMVVFAVMAVASAVGLIWRIRMAHAVTAAAAPIGAAFTFIALVTGALWGKPMWGTYWVWDARLTSELILLFLYFGYLALVHAFPDRRTGDQAGAILAIVGAVDLPIIHFSVQWWTTLHQGATLKLSGTPMPVSMLWPLLVMMLAFLCYFAWLLMVRLRAEILRREYRARWVEKI